MVELPMAPSGAPTCPAASKIVGACTANSGVVCGVMQREHEGVDPSGMTAGEYGFTAREATGGVFLTMHSDPSTVIRFCHGEAMPVLDDADGYARDSFTFCPVWQAEKDRIHAGRASVTNEVAPEPVSMGVEDTLSAANPWASARRDLDLLTR